MTELIFASSTENELPSVKDIEQIVERITPYKDYPDPIIQTDSQTVTAVLSPTEGIPRRDNSVCLGQVRAAPEWDRVGSDRPDGVYTLLRQDSSTAEIITDVVGSRPVWFFTTDSLFIASTSQRAITAIVGDFSLDESTVAWFLSTGTLGPRDGWDSRVKRVPPNTTITIDKRAGDYDLSQRKLEIATGKSDPSQFREKLQETINGYDIDLDDWYLTLSGGFDSRTILSELDSNELNSVTWGLPESLEYEQNDAVIAERLASEHDLSHEFLPLSVSGPELVLEKFILASEGCIDHLSGYVDGMGIWERFASEDKVGIIRGDVPFCYEAIQPTLLRNVGNSELNGTRLAEQQQPYRFLDRRNESRLAHRYRVYYSYELPSELSALTCVKTPYTEVFNPLLTNSFVEWAAQLPEDSLNKKNIQKSYVKRHGSSIPFATSSAIPNRGQYLRRSDVVDVLRAKLADHDGTVVPKDVLEYCLSESSMVTDSDLLSAGETNDSLTRKVKDLIPSDFKRALHERGYVKPTIDVNYLAFRSYIAISMNEYLNEDAEWGRSLR